MAAVNSQTKSKTFFGTIGRRLTSLLGKHQGDSSTPSWTGKKRLVLDSVSSYNLPIGRLKEYLLKSIPEFEKKHYTPRVVKSDDEKVYIFEVPEKLSKAQKNEIDRHREQGVPPTIDEEAS